MANPGSESRERLLAAAMDHIEAHGVADLSLRGLAAAIGTSHRMLIYHFGSKEGLLIAVIRAVEAQQRAMVEELNIDPSLDPSDAMRELWKHWSSPRLAPNERVFFEMYGQALQGRTHTEGFLDDIVSSWFEPAAALYREQGLSKKDAAAQARLGLAVVRGLLLDLLATGDRAGTTAAFNHFIAMYEAWNSRN